MDEQVITILKPHAQSQIITRIIGKLCILSCFIGILFSFGFEHNNTLNATIWILGAIGCYCLIVSWYVVHSKIYTLTTERIIIQEGIIERRTSQVELFKIQNIFVFQSFLNNYFNIGNISIQCGGANGVRAIEFFGIKEPIRAKELIRATYMQAREKNAVKYLEFSPNTLPYNNA